MDTGATYNNFDVVFLQHVGAIGWITASNHNAGLVLLQLLLAARNEQVENTHIDPVCMTEG